MKTETSQERETQLRLNGHILDSLWMEARNTAGQARTDIHNQIGPLREKLRLARKEQEELKNGGRKSNQSKDINWEGSADEDLSAGPKE